MNMKKIGTYFVVGCLVAIVGMFLAGNLGNFFNGMEYGSACVLGIGLYLCIVIVTCTGIIVSKIESKKDDDNSEEK